MRTAKFTVFCVGVLCGSSLLAAPSSSPLSAPIIGRVPTATAPVITNVTEPGKNPAQGDVLKATYTYADPDNDLVDPTKSVFSWSAAGTAISGATAETFTPTAAQNKKFLSFAVTPASLPPADPSKATTPVTSPDSLAPVLPSRAQLESEYVSGLGSKRWGDAYKHCASLNERLPTVAELEALFVTYTRANAVGDDSQADIKKTYGWTQNVYWTNSANGEDRHKYVYIAEDGRNNSNSNSNTYYFACIKAGAAEGLPSVTGVNIPAASPGVPITVMYNYNGNATIPDRSRFQWFTATAANGTSDKSAIDGATTATYTPQPSDAGKWLVVEITPASYDTVVGQTVTTVSYAAVTPAVPIISNVSISGFDQWGTPQIGDTLNGEYTFLANDGGTDASTYRWLGGGSGGTNRSYTLTKADLGRTLTFEVTAKSSTGTLGNIESVSASKGVSIYRLFIAPDKVKYTRMNAPMDNAALTCTSRRGRLPTKDELTTLFRDETSGGTNTDLCSKYDWPMEAQCGGSGMESRYWTDEMVAANQEAYHVDLTNGHVSQTYKGNGFYVACFGG